MLSAISSTVSAPMSADGGMEARDVGRVEPAAAKSSADRGNLALAADHADVLDVSAQRMRDDFFVQDVAASDGHDVRIFADGERIERVGDRSDYNAIGLREPFSRGELGAVVNDGDAEPHEIRQQRDGKRDMAGAEDVQRWRGEHGLNEGANRLLDEARLSCGGARLRESTQCPIHVRVSARSHEPALRQQRQRAEWTVVAENADDDGALSLALGARRGRERVSSTLGANRLDEHHAPAAADHPGRGGIILREIEREHPRLVGRDDRGRLADRLRLKWTAADGAPGRAVVADQQP